MAQHNDRHLTTEQLSASLDNQLSPQEQAEFNIHLQTCRQCQKAQADLKQTVALLHALPQPSLPRSFVLPVSQAIPAMMTHTQEERRPHAHPITTTTRRTRTHRAGSFARQSVRVLSTLAAVIGIVFILSSFVASFPHSTNTASSGSSAVTATYPATQQPKVSAQKTPNQGVSGVTCNQTSPAPVSCETQTPGTTKPSTGAGTPQITSRLKQNQANSPPIDFNSPQVHLGLGAILLLIGVLGVMLTRKRRE